MIDAIAETYEMTKDLFTDFFKPMVLGFINLATQSTKEVNRLDYELQAFNIKLQSSLIEAFTQIVCCIEEITD